MWAAICDAVDTTGHQSSIAGQLLALEVDVEAGGLDDGNCRQGLVIVGATRNYPTVPTSEFARAFGIFNLDPGVTFKDLMTLAGGFNHAGINMVSAGSIGGAPAIWLGNNKTIAWDDEGAATTHWNGTYLQFSRNVGIDGSLSVGTTMAVHGTAEFFSTVQVDGLLYTPANLSVGGTSALVGDVQIDGKVGFNGTAPHAKPTITGAKAGNAALNSLILSLQAYGLIQDSTTA